LKPANTVAYLFRRVGDSLMATPAIRAIKKHDPAAVLSVIAETSVARVFMHNPWIDHIVTVPASPSVFALASAIRREGRPDIALDFLSDPRTAIAGVLSRAPRRIGIFHSNRRWAYSDLIPEQDAAHPVYSATHKLAMAAALGIVERDVTTEFYLAHDDLAFAESAWAEHNLPPEASVTAFFVHSRRDYKRWPLDCFSQVIRRMTGEKTTVPLILATPGDESSAAEVRARSSLSARHVMTVNDLGHLGAILQRCSLLVGNDGGPKHIAVALNIPTVTIFGAEPPVYWTPPDDPRHLVFSSPENMGKRETTASGSSLSPDLIYEAALHLVQPKA
jgi:ADP-heptose:LPS heptosyltransferase